MNNRQMLCKLKFFLKIYGPFSINIIFFCYYSYVSHIVLEIAYIETETKERKPYITFMANFAKPGKLFYSQLSNPFYRT
ncbi:hypothetical protein Fmac_004447 [Flemingia macrophylla]|uniref:Uncharacterized protein n=1 Tax=Flemingia macrophylla TaxID=520843 RepID=A0ABD1N4Y5_9FABA